MLELASPGAKVLQTRCVELAMNHRVRVQVLSSFDDVPGTLVVDEDEIVEKQVVSGIAYSRDEAKITLVAGCRPAGHRRRHLRPARRARVNVDMIVQNISERRHHRHDLHRRQGRPRARTARCSRRSAASSAIAELKPDPNVAKISVIGVGMRSHAGVAQQMFRRWPTRRSTSR